MSRHSSRAAGAESRPKKVLIVDDDEDLRRTIKMLLGDSCSVLEAADGGAAVEAVRKERPRLILLDVSMPGMDGAQTLEAVRAIDRAVTVIMLTGDSGLDTAKRTLDMGAAAYVTKPFDMACMKSDVRRLLSSDAELDETGRQWTRA
jgi:two-component system, response regulator, stage 0 sporulation protein F